VIEFNPIPIGEECTAQTFRARSVQAQQMSQHVETDEGVILEQIEECKLAHVQDLGHALDGGLTGDGISLDWGNVLGQLDQVGIPAFFVKGQFLDALVGRQSGLGEGDHLAQIDAEMLGALRCGFKALARNT
jgi:hypothetical protein